MSFLFWGFVTMAIVTAILNLIAGPQPGDLGYKDKDKKPPDSELNKKDRTKNKERENKA